MDQINHSVGTVWWNDADDFTLLVLTTPNHSSHLTTLILDNGPWPTPAGSLYTVHTISLHRYYERIA